MLPILRGIGLHPRFLHAAHIEARGLQFHPESGLQILYNLVIIKRYGKQLRHVKNGFGVGLIRTIESPRKATNVDMSSYVAQTYNMEKRTDKQPSQKVRSEQLRLAKQAQRQRERQAGLSVVEVRLHCKHAKKLRVLMNTPKFEATLNQWLDQQLVEIDAWPGLKGLAWNRKDKWITAEEALSIYERNWRFIDEYALDESERALIHRLISEVGGGVFNG